MKLCTLICFMVLACIPAFGQTKYYASIKRPNADTPELYRIMWKPFSEELLPSITAFKTKEYLRIIGPHRILDLWKTKDNQVGGMLLDWMNEYVGKQELPTYRGITLANLLSTETVGRLSEFIDSSKLLTIPSNYIILDSKIKYHKFVYRIIYHNGSQGFNSQHLLWDHKLIPQNGVDLIVDKLLRIAGRGILRNIYQYGYGDLFECFEEDGLINCRDRLTPQEKHEYKEKRKKYRKLLSKKDPAIFLD